MKRLFDVTASCVALALLSPILAAIAVAVLVSSGRPVMFRHERIGQAGRPFDVLKFRTMSASRAGSNLAVTVSNDQRITKVGAYLRGFKLDELPQLWNVLRGEMSIVGPRPEVARYVDCYPAEFSVLHTVRPGITDPSSLEFRNEEELLGQTADPERFYIDELLPQKLALSTAYVQDQSFVTDLSLIFQTLRSVVSR